MATIYHDLEIAAPAARVFEGVSSPEKLNEWWTEKCFGFPGPGAEYVLEFTSSYIWKARVSQFDRNSAFELTITDALDDWVGTRVGFLLIENGDATKLRFRHEGWKEESAHFRGSSYCWAMYLRILKRFLETGVRVPYAERDSD